MLTAPELIAKCDELQRQMERDVFVFPPADWAAFQHRLGQWQGAENVRIMLERIDADDKEKDKDL